MTDTQLWCDDGLATGNDDASSPANSLQTFKQGIEYPLFTPTTPNNMWVRRTSSALMSAIWNPSDDGFPAFPIRIIGWPRNDVTIPIATWTLGSNVVQSVSGVSLVRGQHQSRYILAPNGYFYFITRIINSTSFNIDRPYIGPTVSGVAGLSVIQKDPEYDYRPQAGIAANWDDDPDNLPIVNANGGAYYIYFNGDEWYEVRNIDFRNSSGTGILRVNSCTHIILGCLFSSDQNAIALYLQGADINIKRTIIEGSGVGISQRGIFNTGATLSLEDVAIYNMGDNGLQAVTGARVWLENVNIGIETANGDEDIDIQYSSIDGKGVQLGGSNGYVNFTKIDPESSVRIEDYGKVRNKNKTFYRGGIYENVDVTSVPPNKKLSDEVLKITPNLNFTPLNKDQRIKIKLATLELDPGSTEIKYWFYNNFGVTINIGDPELDIYLEADYVNGYNSDDEYVNTKVNSTQQDIPQAADADAWFAFLLNLNPAVRSSVVVNMVISLYNVNSSYLEPQNVITI